MSKFRKTFKRATKIIAASYIAAATVVGLSLLVNNAAEASGKLIVRILRDEA
jgi:hypothetical protein